MLGSGSGDLSQKRLNVPDLAGGDSVDIGFAQWNVGTETDVFYSINVSTILTGDVNINNDTLDISVFAGEPFVCGDANGDETINIFDITFVMNYLYTAGPAPDPRERADVDGDGAVNIFDITYLISYLYMEGPPPNCW